MENWKVFLLSLVITDLVLALVVIRWPANKHIQVVKDKSEKLKGEYRGIV